MRRREKCWLRDGEALALSREKAREREVHAGEVGAASTLLSLSFFVDDGNERWSSLEGEEGR